ncbi:MAG: 2,3-bisphosphoglycerate-independent phosphoglycerate mutase [Desulfobacterales bacterium]|nr:2,3-bisphosphoglycerate-independent phosphoglycerate mutase [Desulfobacterales bacterium]
MTKKTCMLLILDGWGISSEIEGNAVLQAKTPNLDYLEKSYPSAQLLCFGKAVGLPEGTMGNSEVGHLNIGAGRIVYQDLVRINNAIEDGTFSSNENISILMNTVKGKGTALHLMGLLSDGGVHSHINHLFALLDMAAAKGLSKVYIHVILDGRDTPPDSGAGYISRLSDYINEKNHGKIATICGRFYAMDRDKRWERVEQAYRLYTKGDGNTEKDPVDAVKNAYARGETDEFVKPLSMTDADGRALATIQDDDGIIFFNFRADRAREITRTLTDPSFSEFERDPFPNLSGFVCMTLYDQSFTLPMAFSPVHLSAILGEVISNNGLNQLRIAETEKYAHVTYFFNGGEETPFPNEDRCLIPSPRDIPTYDHKPEMSAFEVTEEVIKRIRSDKYDFIVLNFANMDMVGHTGILEAAIKACETVDMCVGKIVDEIMACKGSLLITADHGNSEKMIDESGKPFTAHSINPVRLILVNNDRKSGALDNGKLGDLAPTILEIMNIEQPEEMTGVSLLRK